jgi:hypothetical protein
MEKFRFPVVVKLTTQVFHRHFDDVRLANVLLAPYLLQQLAARDDATRVLHQALK